jgi:F-type H+-transporting ATPase subunit b
LYNILGSMNSITRIGFLLTSEAELPEARILGFDLQLIIQTGFQMAAALLLFYVLGRLLFNPVREILRKRKEEIETTFNKIETDSKEALGLKTEYDAKLKNIKFEADKILSHAHTRAIAREDEIVKEAHEEANRIIQRAHLEIERERESMKDDIRREIIEVATLMASKFVEVSLNEEQQRVLINQTINEMGDDIWSN